MGGPIRVLPGPSPEGLAHPAVGPSSREVREQVPLGWPGEVGRQRPGVPGARGSVPGLIQTPLESVVLVCVRENLVAHPPQQVGRGLCG